MNYISKTISKQAAIVSLSAFILVTAIAGLIMDASGVPWFADGEDRDWDTGKFDSYESQDWDECCEDSYDSIQDSDSYDDGAFDTAILFISPLTSYFVLLLIFSLLCLICAIIPFDIRYKSPTVALFGLATTVTGIFLARKSAITIGRYLEILSSSGDYDASVHLHVMPYFGALLSLVCLLLGSTIILSIKQQLRTNVDTISNTLLNRSQLFLSVSLIILLLSPIVPIGYVSLDTDADYYNEDRGLEGEYLFPTSMLVAADYLAAEGEGSEAEAEVYEATYENYGLVDDLFFALMWINLSVIMLLSMSMLPAVGKIFSGLGQLNILSLPLMIIALIFSIIMYACLPDLLDDGTFDGSEYESFYFHVNWLPLVCCIVVIINWIFMLIKCHIPWWKEMGKSSQNLFENFNRSSSPAIYGNQNMMQRRMAPQQQFNQQQYNQQMPNQQQFNQQQYNQQMYNQQQQRQFGRQPPRF